MNIEDAGRVSDHLKTIRLIRDRIEIIQASTMDIVRVEMAGITTIMHSQAYFDVIRNTTVQWLSERVSDEVVALCSLGVEVEQ